MLVVQTHNNLEAHLVMDAMIKIFYIGINWLAVFVTKPADCAQHQSSVWRQGSGTQTSCNSCLYFTTSSYRVRILP